MKPQAAAACEDGCVCFSGHQEYHELTAGQRIQTASLLCSLATASAATRTQLTDAEDMRKEMRKEQLALKTKLKRWAQLKFIQQVIAPKACCSQM